ncbi:hypothetical protein [Flindersiella endophytica]
MSRKPDWYAELADALRSRRLEASRISEIVAEARAHCDATGEQPYAAFGDASAYAARLMSAEDPEETRFRHTARRYSWSAQPARYRLLITIGGALAVFAAYDWLVAGESYSWEASLVVAMPLSVGAFALAQLRDDSRNAGRPAAARWLTPAFVAALIVGILSSFVVPEGWTIAVPAPELLILGLAMLGAGWWLGDRWQRAHLTSEASLSHDEWLDRLAGLLEGRYRLPVAKARDFRAEAASHLAETGGDPSQEFGPVDDYAAELAERSGLSRSRPKTPACYVRFVAMVLCAGVTAMVIAGHGLFSVRTAIIGAATVLAAADLLRLTLAANRRRRVAAQSVRR